MYFWRSFRTADRVSRGDNCTTLAEAKAEAEAAHRELGFKGVSTTIRNHKATWTYRVKERGRGMKWERDGDD